MILFHLKWRLDFIPQKLYIWGHVSLAGILNNGNFQYTFNAKGQILHMLDLAGHEVSAKITLRL